MIGAEVAQLGSQVNDGDDVFVGGNLVSNKGKEDIFIAFHKPVGVISTFDKDSHNTLADWVDVGERIFNVGRLDVASSGLILLTNNGEVSEAITHPRGNHEKEYVVTLDKPYTRSFIDQMKSGVILEDGMTKPARAKKISNTRFELILTEGRNRQIRRMCEKLGFQVKKLKRTRVMNVKLGELGDGNWRLLTKKERRELQEQL